MHRPVAKDRPWIDPCVTCMCPLNYNIVDFFCPFQEKCVILIRSGDKQVKNKNIILDGGFYNVFMYKKTAANNVGSRNKINRPKEPFFPRYSQEEQ